MSTSRLYRRAARSAERRTAVTISKHIVIVVLAASVNTFGPRTPSINDSTHASQQCEFWDSTADRLSFGMSIRHDKAFAGARALFAVHSQDDPDGCCIQS